MGRVSSHMHMSTLCVPGCRLDGTQLPESWVRRREVPMQIFGKGSEDQAGATAGAANGGECMAGQARRAPKRWIACWWGPMVLRVTCFAAVATGAMGAHAVAEDGGAADDNPERLRAVLGALDVAKVQAARSAAATAPGVAGEGWQCTWQPAWAAS